jgi:hypothetical protein
VHHSLANGNPALAEEVPMPAVQTFHRTRNLQNRRKASAPVVPAERVRQMLREIAFVLHATRVVGREGGVAPKKG